MEFKIAHIFKSSNKPAAFNYRPVSLTPVVHKVLERIIKKTIILHLLDNCLINKNQHGFIPGKSCITNLLESQDILTQALDEGYPIEFLFTGFLKTFDRVSHRKGIFIIEMYGIRGRILKWIESFLSSRRQRVVLGQNG